MTEKQRHEVVAQHDGFELRRYPAHLAAEVEVDGAFADAGNRAFGVLVAFISGRNTTRGKVAMTAPVVQEQASSRIAMTAPVVQESSGAPGRHVVAFVMPHEYTLATLPAPTDPRVRIREVPAQMAAVQAYRGRWSEAIYRDHLTALRAAVARDGLTVVGEPRFARFDPPWTPWPLRRNEVVLPVVVDAQPEP